MWVIGINCDYTESLRSFIYMGFIRHWQKSLKNDKDIMETAMFNLCPLCACDEYCSTPVFLRKTVIHKNMNTSARIKVHYTHEMEKRLAFARELSCQFLERRP